MNPVTSPAVLPLLPTTTPNEVCITLYFEHLSAMVPTAPTLRHQLRPAVGDWQQVTFEEVPVPDQLASVYEATQPPTGFASVHLLAFESTFSLHTEVVQLILSSYAPYDVAWPQATAWLAHVLAATLTTQPVATGFLGYTLVYRANLDHELTPTLTLDPTVLQFARSIHQPAPPTPVRNQILAQQPVPQGWLLLVEYPLAPAQGLVYIALGQAGRSDKLADILFAGPSATLVTQDIFVHKTLSQSWAANLDYDAYSASSLTPFKESITNLLQVVDNPRLKNEQLDNFAQALATTTHTQWKLNRLEHSLQQQFNGLRRQFAPTELPIIARRHLATLESHWQEVLALVRQHQLVIENARAAISLVEAQETKHANAKQQRFNQIFAFGGILFAAFSALDNDFARIFWPAASHLTLYLLRLSLAIGTASVFALVYLTYKASSQKSRAKRVTRQFPTPADMLAP